MTIAILPSQDDITTDLTEFLATILPGVPAVLGQGNRVAPPNKPDYIVMTPIRRERLETNIDTFSDVFFTGSIDNTGTLTVTGVFYGSLSLGSVIFGVGVIDGTYITQLGTGTGSVGTYIVSNTTVIAARNLAAGTQKMTQPVNVTIQLDVHGPNSGNNAFQISTMFRDEYAFDLFTGYGHDVAPLHADNPVQTAFIDDSKQYEDRWTIDACLQANQAVVNIPQEFFDQIVVGLIDVDAKYPA